MVTVKRFIVDFRQLDNCELYLFIAMKADPNHFLYQEQTSCEWRTLDKNIQTVEITDQAKYRKQLRTVMSLLQVEAASIFEGLSDSDSLLGQSW